MAAGALGQGMPVCRWAWRWRPALATALLASVALHLGAGLGSRGPVGGGASRAQAIAVRVIGADTAMAQTAGDDPPATLRKAAAPSAVAMPTRAMVRPMATVHSARSSALVAVADPAPITQPAPPAGLPPAPGYRGLAGLDSPPRLLHEIEPEYPGVAGQQDGTVVLRLLISDKGEVDNAAVVRSAPKGFFEAAAIEAWSKAAFSPGTFLGVPVKCQMTIEVQFNQLNRGATVAGRGY